MLRTSALEGRPSCSAQAEHGALLPPRLRCMKMATLKLGRAKITWLLLYKVWALPLTSFLLLQIGGQPLFFFFPTQV